VSAEATRRTILALPRRSRLNTYISLVAQSNVRAVGITGDFERVLSFGIGLDHTAAIHVSTLTGPNRLVIDVDH
jgi:hypothetical protein